MMPLDICIESYGAAVHVVDTLFSSGLYLRPRNEIGAAAPCGEQAFGAAVHAASTDLSFLDAQALWLVDVCGCSYDEAAAEARTTRDHIAARVAAGRQHILRAVEANAASTA